MFPSPAAQSFLINGHKHCVFGRGTTLVPATPGWAEICGPAVVRGFGVRLALPCIISTMGHLFPRGPQLAR